MIRYFFLLAFIFSSIDGFSQKSRHTYVFYDNETKKPIHGVRMSFDSEGLNGMSDYNGILNFKLKRQFDSVTIYHGNYSSIKTKLKSHDTIYPKRITFYIGGFQIKNPMLPDDLDCDELVNLSDTKVSDYFNKKPMFKGGWICFDNYIYSQFILNDLDKLINIKKIDVVFTIHINGKIKRVLIESKIDDNTKMLIEEIFLNSPIWIPLFYENNFYESDVRYSIKY